MKEALLPSVSNDRYQCWSNRLKPINCKANIQNCRVYKRTDSKINSHCHDFDGVDQASLVIQATLSAMQNSTTLLWNMPQNYFEKYTCSHSLCNSPNTTQVIFNLNKKYYDPSVYIHDILKNSMNEMELPVHESNFILNSIFKIVFFV